MKREAYRHPKMYDLAARLSVTRATAIGLIQLLLDYTADVAPQGNIGKWPNGTIARACEWDRNPDEFVDALVGAGWLDKCVQHRLVIHNLKDHAERWWVMKLQKLNLPFLSASIEASIEHTTEITTETAIEASPSRDLYSTLLYSTLPNKENSPDGNSSEEIKAREKINKNTTKPLFVIPIELNHSEFLEAWQRWVKHRKELKKAVTETSGQTQLDQFAIWGSDRAIAAINYTIAKGWQGIREPEQIQGIHQPSKRQEPYYEPLRPKLKLSDVQ